MQKQFKFNLNSNIFFRQIFQNLSEGIVVVNIKGIIVLVNSVTEKMFGYQSGELCGKLLEELLPEKVKSVHVAHREAFNDNPKQRKMGMGVELRALKKDGKEFPVEISLSHASDNGNLFGIALISDITTRKKSDELLQQSEEQLIRYASELEKKILERTQNLSNHIIQLERKVKEIKRVEEETRKALAHAHELNELKTKFVSIASHEFRTPLSTILSSIGLIEKYTQLNDYQKINKHSLRIKSSVKHLGSILNDFLSLGKLEEGKLEVFKEWIDLRPFIDDICEEVKPLLKDKQEIVVIKKGGVNIFITDPKILRNILFNLLSNAIKYSKSNTKIYLKWTNIDDILTMNIQDEGMGIPQKEQKYLFDRFFRASNVTHIEGTGLGLNIVKRYVGLLNGEIKFSSKQSVGTTFVLTIENR